MSGRRNIVDSIGSAYEKFVDALMTPIASMIGVQREDDFGIDFYFHPRIPVGPRTETVTELAALQIKGATARLSYGGLKDGEWRKHEFAWLLSLATPLYLAQVDQGRRVLEVFSLAPLWRHFLEHAVYPFEVSFTTQPASFTGEWKQQPPACETGEARGDGLRWTLDLGVPIVRLSVDDSNDAAFKQNIVAVLRTWINQDRLNMMRFLQGFPVANGFSNWRTNSIEGMSSRTWQFWDTQPGANIERLCHSAEPLIVNLGIHLKSQNDSGAYALVPALRWLDGRHQLGGIGQGLLGQLVASQERWVGPGDDASVPNRCVEVSPSPSDEDAEAD